MSVDRTQFRQAVRTFFTRLERWQPDPEESVNICRDALAVGETEEKAKRYAQVIAQAAEQARVELDVEKDWDALVGGAGSKMGNASLYYLFTGEEQALGWAREALDVMDGCDVRTLATRP